jgi:hypothetical protein
MKLKIDINLKNFKGEELTEGNNPINLKDVITGALLMPEEATDGKEKAARYFMAQRVENSGDNWETTAEEITKVKELVGKFYTPIIVGQAYEILEGEDKK